MKRYFGVLFLFCFLLTPTIAVHADVILEPSDIFYLFNANNCEYLGQSFYADGVVSVKEEPGSNVEVAAIENNAQVYIYCTYALEGKTWGLVVEEENILRFYGWVLMDRLLPAVNVNPTTGGLQALQQRVLFSPALLAIPVAAVAVGMAVLIRAFWKPKRGKG
jgi:hypothetical protein